MKSILVGSARVRRLTGVRDRFKLAIFDFEGVEGIGQAFADKIFRVFAKHHPGIEIVPVQASTQVQHMINGAISHWNEGQ